MGLFAVLPTDMGIELVVDSLGQEFQVQFVPAAALCHIDIALQRVSRGREMHLTIGIERSVIGEGRQIAIEVEGAAVVVHPHVEHHRLRDAQIDMQEALQPV